MRRILLSFMFAIAILGGLAAGAFAQAPIRGIVEVRLRDGSVIVGQIVSDDGERAVIKTVSGADITVTRDQFKSIQDAAGAVVDGEFWTEDAVTSKLFLGPTGRALKRGQGYVAIDSIFI